MNISKTSKCQGFVDLNHAITYLGLTQWVLVVPLSPFPFSLLLYLPLGRLYSKAAMLYYYGLKVI